MRINRIITLSITIMIVFSVISSAREVAVFLPLTDKACRDLERKLSKRGYNGVVLEGNIGPDAKDKDTYLVDVRYRESSMEVGMSKRLGIVLKSGEIESIKELD